MEYIPLSNGVNMPMLGYGVYQVDPATCEKSVREAIEVGYRAIDTAQAYHNEAGVGSALKQSGLPREDFFITTKVWVSNAGYEKAAASIEESLRKLQTDYIDLLLIHQPFNDYYGTWRAMEEAYRAGKVRAIGVSNFFPRPAGGPVPVCGDSAHGKPGGDPRLLPADRCPRHYGEVRGDPPVLGTPLPRGGRTSSPTPSWPRWGPSTASPWPRWPCASCCKVAWWSSPSRSTRNGWRKICRSLISSWTRRIWLPSGPWTRGRAPSFPTMTRPRWSLSPALACKPAFI